METDDVEAPEVVLDQAGQDVLEVRTAFSCRIYSWSGILTLNRILQNRINLLKQTLLLRLELGRVLLTQPRCPIQCYHQVSYPLCEYQMSVWY